MIKMMTTANRINSGVNSRLTVLQRKGVNILRYPIANSLFLI